MTKKVKSRIVLTEKQKERERAIKAAADLRRQQGKEDKKKNGKSREQDRLGDRSRRSNFVEQYE